MQNHTAAWGYLKASLPGTSPQASPRTLGSSWPPGPKGTAEKSAASTRATGGGGVLLPNPAPQLAQRGQPPPQPDLHSERAVTKTRHTKSGKQVGLAGPRKRLRLLRGLPPREAWGLAGTLRTFS